MSIQTLFFPDILIVGGFDMPYFHTKYFAIDAIVPAVDFALLRADFNAEKNIR